jgi:2,3-bisphosphoglycerate-dependent phosphoglycerate mutase
MMPTAPAQQVTRITAIRHGETDWNVGTRIQGFTDIPLNHRGELQAQRVANALTQWTQTNPGQTIHAVYASDLSRALETGRSIATALGLPVQIEAGMRERGYGEFEGHAWDTITTRWPEKAASWKARDPHFTPEGGESLLMFQERILQAFDRVAAQHLGQHIVCAVHGGVLDILYRAAAGIDLRTPRTWGLTNTAINQLSWRLAQQNTAQAQWELHSWGDVSHLDGLDLDEGRA